MISDSMILQKIEFRSKLENAKGSAVVGDVNLLPWDLIDNQLATRPCNYARFSAVSGRNSGFCLVCSGSLGTARPPQK